MRSAMQQAMQSAIEHHETCHAVTCDLRCNRPTVQR